MYQTPDPISSSTLGEVVEEFRPGLDRLVAGVIVGLMMIGGGVALGNLCVNQITERNGQLPLFVEKGVSWASVGLGFLVTTGLIIGAGFFFWYVRILRRQRVELCNGGFRYYRGDTCEEVAWGRIQSIEETIIYQRPPILKGPAKLLIPVHAGYSYVVYTSEKAYAFNADSLRGIQAFGKRLRALTESQGISWKTVEQHG